MNKHFLVIILQLFLINSFNIKAFSTNDSLDFKSKIDSLYAVFNKVENDTIKIGILNDEIGIILESINIDSALHVYEMAVEIADKHLQGTPFESKSKLNEYSTSQINNVYSYSSLIKSYADLKASSLMYIGIIYNDMGSFSSAIENILYSLSIYELIDNKHGVLACNGNLGNIYTMQGNYPKGLESFIKSLNVSENILKTANDENEKKQLKKGMSYAYLGIGNIHLAQKNYPAAIEYIINAQKIAEELNDKTGIALCYNNLGNIYSETDKQDLAIFNYLKSLSIQEELNDKNSISICLENIGSAYKDKADKMNNLNANSDSILMNYKLALDYFQKSFSIFDEIGNKNGKAFTFVSMSSLHNSLAEYYKGGESTKHLNIALELGHNAISLAEEINSYPIKSKAASVLMEIYKKLNDYKKAMEFAEVYIDSRDSMFREEKTTAIANAEKLYEAEKKQNEIELLNKDKELKDTEISKQKAVKNYLYGIVSLVLIFFAAMIIAYRNKRKSNFLLKLQNIEITERNEEIEQQKEELTVQSEALAKANRVLEAKNNQITESINYANTIQTALMPSEMFFSQQFKEYFIYFRPKDIVSGDFYWASEVDDNIFIAVADCTGHGVPGAFMSMIGNTLLNQIVNEKEILDPSQILKHLNQGIVFSLEQHGNSGFSGDDGMDITICRINKSQKEITISAANQTSLIIVDDKHVTMDGSIFAIGKEFGRNINKEFKNEIFNYIDSANIYMFSDGYYDQFGGPHNKRFNKIQIISLLNEMHNLPYNQQYNQLNEVFDSWKDNNKQTDDILVLGIKV